MTYQDRVLAVLLAAVALGYGWSALALEVRFQYEPLGPKAFPVILAGLMLIAAGRLWYRPDRLDWRPDRSLLARLAWAQGLLLAYALLFVPLGFITATTLVGALFCRLFGGKPWVALAYGLLMSLISYGLLKILLQLNLPDGLWWSA